MKRVVLLCLLLVGVLALTSPAMAATSAGISVTVTLQKVSVALSQSSWAIGVIAAGGTATSTLITADNDGNVTENLSIATTVTAPDGWAPGASSGVDTYVLEQNASGSYAVVTTSPSSLASNVAASGSASFNLRFTAPASGSASTGQNGFTVTVSAAAAP